MPFLALAGTTWGGLSDGVAILVIVGLLAFGAAAGYAARALVGRWLAGAIERRAGLREKAGEAEVAARLKEADIAARAAVVKAKEEFELSTRARRDELNAVEERQTRREANLDRKSAALDEREAAVAAKADAAAKAAHEAQETARAADSRLQSLARMTHLDARKEILAQANAELRADAAILSRRIQEAARERGNALAAQILAEAVQRCAASHVAELTTTAIPLPDEDAKGRVVGRDGRNVRAFEAASGVSVLLDESPGMVVLSSFDPVRRETARLAMADLLADGRIHPSAIESALAKAAETVEASMSEAGAEAAAEVGVSGLSSETARMMGMLKYRTSFTQNVLRHSVEVALLSGVMASELGLDADLARRIGFLHDVGKAMTAEKKGAHAILGAEWLAAHGEAESVCSAVAAHHGDPGTDGGVYGAVCAAADAISSARPGARRENAANYVERLEQVERLAMAHSGVVNAFAVQSGRDLRVFVDPKAVADADAASLAGEICREVSERAKVPGTVRVTVVRELKCVEYAR